MYIQNKTDYGYIRVASAVPSVNVADVGFNVKSILSSIEQAKQCDAQMLVLPELCVTAYTCADLFGNEQLLDAAEEGIQQIPQRRHRRPQVPHQGTQIRPSLPHRDRPREDR